MNCRPEQDELTRLRAECLRLQSEAVRLTEQAKLMGHLRDVIVEQAAKIQEQDEIIEQLRQEKRV